VVRSSAASDVYKRQEFYLRTLTRFPDAEELAAARNAIRKAANRQQGAEDVLWALLNAKEFLYNH
jgi:hypothetical protein